MSKKVYVNMHNPVLPPEIHMPDVEGHVMPDGKLYMYGSFDKNSNEFCSDEYHVASTDDLKHWYVSDKAFTTNDGP